MPLATLPDRLLAEIDRGLDNLVLPSPEQVRALISEVRDQRRHISELTASQLRLARALRDVQTTADTVLQLEAKR